MSPFGGHVQLTLSMDKNVNGSPRVILVSSRAKLVNPRVGWGVGPAKSAGHAGYVVKWVGTGMCWIQDAQMVFILGSLLKPIHLLGYVVGFPEIHGSFVWCACVCVCVCPLVWRASCHSRAEEKSNATLLGPR